MLRVHSIYIYPIKSLSGILVKEVEIDSKGLKGDREFILVDENAQMITQRKYPELTRFKTEFLEGQLRVLDIPSSDQIIIQEGLSGKKNIQVQVWDDLLFLDELNPIISQWFTEKLGFNVFLLKFKEGEIREINPKYQGEFSKTIRFVDGMPISILSTGSFQKLHDYYGNFNWQRFRANLIIENDIPHQEDDWTVIEIGKVKLQSKKLCKRCNLITVDPDSGIVDSNLLKILATYRSWDNHIYFGNQFVPINSGKIQLDDSITIQ